MVEVVASKKAIKVRLNKSLAPARLLSLSTTGDFVLDEFAMTWSLLNPYGKDSSGDGLFEAAPLKPSTHLDLFIYEPTQNTYPLEGMHHAAALTIPPRQMLCLAASWAGIDGEPSKGNLRILWSHEELRAGRAPRIAHGSDVEAIDKYFKNPGQPVTSQLIRIRRRVREVNRADIRERRRREERIKLMADQATEPTLINSLSVTGYRGFRETGTLKLAEPKLGISGSGLTVVVGANSAGKSSLWESFDAIARKRNSDVSFPIERRNQLSELGVQLSITRTDGSSYVVESLDRDTSETKASWNPGDVNTDDEQKIVVIPSRRYFRATFGKHSGTRPDWMSTNGNEYSRYQERDPFTGRLFNLHADKTRKAGFDKLLKKVVGHSLDWKIDLAEGQGGSSYFLKVTTEGVTHNSDGLGDGVISLLFILDALYDADPRTLLVIDEPELSLHPQLIRRLGREIARVAAERQIVIFTHSPILISWDDVEAGAEIARVYKTGADSRIAQVPRETIEKISKVRGGWKNPHALGSDANEALFLDDEIIVVEGQEDAGLLPRVFEQVGMESRGTIFGWGAGGGDGNPRRIVELLAALGFTKVVTLLDADKRGEVDAIRNAFPGYLTTTIPADDIRDKPADNFLGKSGLLDKKGKTIKEELKADTQSVLQSVVDYFNGPDKVDDSVVDAEDADTR